MCWIHGTVKTRYQYRNVCILTKSANQTGLASSLFMWKLWCVCVCVVELDPLDAVKERVEDAVKTTLHHVSHPPHRVLVRQRTRMTKCSTEHHRRSFPSSGHPLTQFLSFLLMLMSCWPTECLSFRITLEIKVNLLLIFPDISIFVLPVVSLSHSFHL